MSLAITAAVVGATRVVGGGAPPSWESAVPDARFRAALERKGISSLPALQAATSINLSSVALTGSVWTGIEYATSLTFLDLNSTSVSGDLAAVSGLTSLTYLNLNNTSISGDVAAVSGLTSLTIVFLRNTSIATATSPTLTTHPGLSIAWLDGTNLTQAGVDTVLADCVTSLNVSGRVTCNLRLHNNAAPSTTGVTDANTLVSAGWTVTTD